LHFDHWFEARTIGSFYVTYNKCYKYAAAAVKLQNLTFVGCTTTSTFCYAVTFTATATNGSVTGKRLTSSLIIINHHQLIKIEHKGAISTWQELQSR